MDKKVLITGGTRGIGLATTELFVKNNFKVIVLARSFENFPLEGNSHIQQITFDLGKVKKIPELIDTIGDVDVLINNAGILNALSYNQYTDVKRDYLLNVNLIAPFELIRLLSKSMILKGSGRIINTASVAAFIGSSDIYYAASKAAIVNITKSFANILGPKGIQVNAVAPGPVDTDMGRRIPKVRSEQFKQTSISKRYAKPEEIAKIIYWLATDAPEYLNGICIDASNGAVAK